MDAASTDATFEIASEFADVAYRFRHPDQFAPARMLPFDYASGDWILSLDDDESMEPTFDRLRDELLAGAGVTHYYFLRKWIVSLAPPQYARSPLCFPDWQLRLFRNDAALVWKPPRAHTGYRVQGRGYFEERSAVLHFEVLWCDEEKRQWKHEGYRRTGAVGPQFQYISPSGHPRDAAILRPKPGRRVSPPARRVLPEVRELTVAARPGWKASLSIANFPATVAPGAFLLAEMVAQNTGTMAWLPLCGQWPILNLAFHLSKNREMLQYDGPRFAVQRPVRPGQSLRFFASFTAPSEPGQYELEWDMVSELECWFQDCGSETVWTSLEVK